MIPLSSFVNRQTIYNMSVGSLEKHATPPYLTCVVQNFTIGLYQCCSRIELHRERGTSVCVVA